MGEFSFENQALGAFMTYRLDGEETLDSLAMGMLSNNQIPGILPVSCVRTDGGQVIFAHVICSPAVRQGALLSAKKNFLGVSVYFACENLILIKLE